MPWLAGGGVQWRGARGELDSGSERTATRRQSHSGPGDQAPRLVAGQLIGAPEIAHLQCQLQRSHSTRARQLDQPRFAGALRGLSHRRSSSHTGQAHETANTYHRWRLVHNRHHAQLLLQLGLASHRGHHRRTHLTPVLLVHVAQTPPAASCR